MNDPARECCASIFFLFSSRRRHTSSDRDWSSDVCSSDLYPANGPKKLWPGLVDLQPKKLLDPEKIDIEELKLRLLGIQALETARCFEEKVLTDVREADVGSILGFGFAPFSGGTLSYIDMMGTRRFVELCRKLEKKYGARFAPSKLLIDMAERNEGFYQRFAPGKRKEAA